jgi:preprotein translocase subunit SecB
LNPQRAAGSCRPTRRSSTCNEAQQFADSLYEVVVTVIVTKAGDKTFLAEAAQAGIFTVRGVPAEELDRCSASRSTIYPTCASDSDLVTRGGFPPVPSPVSLWALYTAQAGRAGQRRRRAANRIAS